MEIGLLTYNVLFNQAFTRLGPVLKQYHPDLLCLQEVDTQDINLKLIEDYGYRLADYSNSFLKFGRIYGQATFYHRNSPVKFINSNALYLKKSVYELLSALVKTFKGDNSSRTILETRFALPGGREKIIVYNLHLSNFGLNGIRLKQLNQLLTKTRRLRGNPALIVTGDFNYPYGRKKLERLMQRYQLREATRNVNFTFKRIKGTKYNPFICWGDKLISLLGRKNHKLDYIFYRGLNLRQTEKINIQLSDHYPILSRFITR
ncbi:endonuclease/exonuclease/phosphatase family protein [Patescibacteria group bacterium]|nr:endonuclease/exonuclease/phosphatase family protein [Patescibacteria group bacterium]MCL5091385.1 endonuclease/exonuclease/phosphatase family protein [Patescibacteria group bacterium]